MIMFMYKESSPDARAAESGAVSDARAVESGAASDARAAEPGAVTDVRAAEPGAVFDGKAAKKRPDSGTSDSVFEHIIAVTNRRLCSRPFLSQIERICRCHPRAVLLREKDLTEEEYMQLAREVVEICRSFHVPCILHTWPGTAERLGCNSVHLPLPLLRSCSGSLPVRGTSVHSLEEALEAQRLGADYLIAGHIYATSCKAGVPPRGTQFLQEICRSVDIPVYAIGGIKPDARQVARVMECGAEGACVMSGMMEL